jgi:HupE / UreJ protein
VRLKGRSSGAIAAILMCVVLSAAAEPLMHDLPQDTVMHAFFQVQGNEAHLLVRVPLDLLHGISWPTIHGEYAIDDSRAAVNQALDALGHAILIWQDGERLMPTLSSGQLAALGDLSFVTPEAAAAHIAQPPDTQLKIALDLGYLDAHFIYPIRPAAAVFSIQSRVAEDLQELSRLIVQFVPAGNYRFGAMTISPQSGKVALNPNRRQAALGFVLVGMQNLLANADCLLFIVCLMIPLRRARDFAAPYAAFFLANLISLAGTAFGFAPRNVWFAAVAASVSAVLIFFMALGNIFGADLQRRRLWTGLFGFVLGFEFAQLLAGRLQFAGEHSQIALWFFALGVDLGALLAMALIFLALALILRGARAGRIGIIVLSALVAHASWHWMIDRMGALWAMPWPTMTVSGFYHLAQWIFAVLLAVGAYTLAAQRIERRWPKAPSPLADQVIFNSGPTILR